MKLTKEEKEELARQALDDVPENFAIFSPWTSLWLLEILLIMASSGMLAYIFVNAFHPLQTYHFFSLLFILTILCMVANAFLVHGFSESGVKLIKAISYIFILFSIFIFFFNGSYIYYCFLILLSSCFCLFLVDSVRFKVFLGHRKEMLKWRRFQFKKNEFFKEKIKENRRRSGQ